MKTYYNQLKHFLILSIIFGTTFILQAQDWTWIKGTNSTNENPYYGTQGVVDVFNSPGARKTATTWTDTLGNLWLFGGLGYDNTGLYGRLNDLWKYDVVTNQWTWVNGQNYIHQAGLYMTKGIANSITEPGARDHAISMVDIDGNLWLFGGYGVAGDTSMGSLNDLWKYNIANNQWTWMGGDTISNPIGVYGIQGAATPSNVPGGRAAGVAWMDNNNNFWLMGGIGVDATGVYGLLSDVWQYDFATAMWTHKKGAAFANISGIYGTQGQTSSTSRPGGRYSQGAWTDTLGNLWMFGGYGYADGVSYGFLNDLWKYDIYTNNWTWINGSNSNNAAGNYGVQGLAYTTSTPGARWEPMTWVDKNNSFWMLGGYGRSTGLSYGTLNDLWQYNTQTNEWIWMSGESLANSYGVYNTQGIYNPTNNIGARESGATWVDKDSYLWVYGGNGNATFTSGLLDDLWRYVPNQMPIIANISTVDFCTQTTNFSIPVTVTDLDNDSISFFSMVNGASIITPNTITIQHLGGYNYELQGTLNGTTGTATVMFQAIDSRGASDLMSFQINVASASFTIHNYQICQGDSILIGGVYHLSSFSCNDTLSTVTGCDSIITTNLVVTTPIITTQYASICQGDSYFFGGQSLNLSGVYQDVLISFNGCDSIVELILNVNPIISNSIVVDICQGNTYFFGGQLLSASGVYLDILVSFNGCDSVVELVLNVNPIINNIINASICQGDTYLFNNQTIDTSGVYQETLVNYIGCDSVNSLILTIIPTVTTTITRTICQGDTYTFGGQLLSVTGIYQDTLTNSNGCDSINTLILKVESDNDTTINAIINQGDNYFFGGVSLTSTGIYVDTLINLNGCDSIITLTLTVQNVTLISCNSTETAQICQGDFYIFGNQTLTTSGTYQDTLVGYNGCDSVITLCLIVNMKTCSNRQTTICHGASYLFGNQTLTSSGVYTQVLVGINGCDSIVTLILTVSPMIITTTYRTICEGYKCYFGGLAIDTSGVYQDTLISWLGCDSISVLILNVYPLTEIVQSLTICQGDSVFLAGAYQKTQGFYKDTLFNAQGCPYTITTILFVQNNTVVTIDTIICQGDSIWLENSYRYTEGTYYDVQTNASGCPTTIITNLQVIIPPSIEWFPNLADTICLQSGPIMLNPVVNYTNYEISNNFLNPMLMTQGNYTIEAIYEFASGCYQMNTKTIYAASCGSVVSLSKDLPYFNVFPNPSDGKFSIEMGITNTDYYELIISDELGRIWFKNENYNLQKQDFEQLLPVCIEQLNTGVYFARLVTELGVIVQKVQIVK